MNFMKLGTDQSPASTAVNSQLEELLEIEEQKQRFQILSNTLTEFCWDICMDNPTNRLSDKTNQCLVNCVDRFLDTTNFVMNRLKFAIANSRKEKHD